MPDFSTQSALYAKFRPKYPKELYDFIFSHIKNFGSAWDVGTGSGQVAAELSKRFDDVIATDSSEQQLRKAAKRANIIYRLESAESTEIPDHSIDLITVGQALHWFDIHLFFKEVNRVLKPGGMIAIIGYGVFSSEAEVDRIVNNFYTLTIDKYWDPQRKYIDEGYKTIPFPFQQIEAPEFKMEFQWTAAELIGYLQSWSAVQAYKKENGQDPVEAIIPELNAAIPSKVNIRFPLLFKIGTVSNEISAGFSR